MKHAITTTDAPAPQRWGQIRVTLLAELRAVTELYEAEHLPIRSSAKLVLMRALIDRLGMIVAAGDAGILETIATDTLKAAIFELRSWMTAPEHPRGVAVAQYDWLWKEHSESGLDGTSWPDVAELLCQCGRQHGPACQGRRHSARLKQSFVAISAELCHRDPIKSEKARVRGRGKFFGLNKP